MLEDSHIGQCIVDHLLENKSTIDDPVLTKWLNESEANRTSFQTYSRIWKETRNLSAIREFDAAEAWQRVNAKNNNKDVTRRHMNNLIYTLSGVAASLLLIVVFNLFKPQQQPGYETALEVKTNYGNRSDITLPDGSLVTLNAGSSLNYTYNFQEKAREVKFSGEGFFEIAKDEKPFQIRIPGDLMVKVLGTTFNLSAYEDDEAALITLLEGSVELSYENNKLLLKPGQIVLYDKQTHQMKYAEGRLAHTYGWLNNKLYMEDMTLAKVCRYLERWYNVEIKLEGDIGEKIRYTGVLEEETIVDVLSALSKLSKIKYQIKGKKIMISPK